MGRITEREEVFGIVITLWEGPEDTPIEVKRQTHRQLPDNYPLCLKNGYHADIRL